MLTCREAARLQAEQGAASQLVSSHDLCTQLTLGGYSTALYTVLYCTVPDVGLVAQPRVHAEPARGLGVSRPPGLRHRVGSAGPVVELQTNIPEDFTIADASTVRRHEIGTLEQRS